MNNTLRSADCPAPDENRIEEILSTIQPLPGHGFHQKMRGAPWQAARIQQGKSTMKTKFAFSALASLLILAATIAFVPPVRAQISHWFTIAIRDPNNGSSVGTSGNQPMKYQILQPGYLPRVLSDNRTIAKFGETIEILYKTDDKFLILTQMAAVAGESLPEGEATTVNGQPAVLNRDLSGIYRELPEGVHSSDGGGVAFPNDTTSEPVPAPTIEPLTFDYTGAVRLTFITGNTKIELLSNLSDDEILKIAAELVPAK